jgi:transcriptional regulator with GAF, ATPase, and Fis domain
VDVNCSAIPETLLEAELFGFERGAFTDARPAKAGLFQAANGGTMFLDEVGLLPLPMQAKRLKVIEERSVRRLGSTRSEPLDISVIAATSEDVPAAVQAGRFRADLYHRLAVVTLTLPALRARTGCRAAGGALPGPDVRRLWAAGEDAKRRRAVGADGVWLARQRARARKPPRASRAAQRRAALTPAVLALPNNVLSEESGAGASADDEEERRQLLDVLVGAAWNFSHAAAQLGITAEHAALSGRPPGAYGAVEATAGRLPATRSRSASGCCTDYANHAKARPPAADVSRNATGGR